MAYLALKFIHVLSALLAFGASLTYGVWALRGAKGPDHEGFALQGLLWIDSYLVNPAFTVAGLSGIALVALGGPGWDLLWVRASLAVFLFTTALSWGVYRPLARLQWGRFSAHGASDPRYQRHSVWAARLGLVFTAANVGLVALMVFQPAGL
jgi:uncharacterized membrane protein